MPDDNTTPAVAEKAMTAADRRSPGVRMAGPDGSFPIRPGHPEDVRNAWDLAGHAADPAAVRRKIREIAAELGMGDALPDTAKEGGKSIGETLVGYGTEAKSLGGNRVGGYLVVFDADDSEGRDLVGDYFPPRCYFGIRAAGAKSAVLYDHALDPEIGDEEIGEGTLKIDDTGVWIEAEIKFDKDPARWSAEQIKRREDYEEHILGLVKANKLGWSSGTASHRVRREGNGARKAIVRWPLGLDASLTPAPCEPRTSVVPLKSLAAKAAADAGLGYDDSGRDSMAAMAALQQLASSLCSAVCDCMGSDPDATPPAERDARIRAEFADFSEDGLAVVFALLSGDEAAAKAILSSPHETRRTRRAAAAPTLAEFSDRLVADATELAGLFRKAHEQRHANGRHLSPAKLDAVKALAATFASLERAVTPPPSAGAVRAMRIRLMRATLAS